MSQSQNRIVFTALHGMQTWSSDENSVRPSVCPSICLSNACIVTPSGNVQLTLQSCKAFIGLTIRAKMIARERPLLPEILGQIDRVGTKSPIFDLFSPVAPQP